MPQFYPTFSRPRVTHPAAPHATFSTCRLNLATHSKGRARAAVPRTHERVYTHSRARTRVRAISCQGKKFEKVGENVSRRCPRATETMDEFITESHTPLPGEAFFTIGMKAAEEVRIFQDGIASY